VTIDQLDALSACRHPLGEAGKPLTARLMPWLAPAGDTTAFDDPN
jgi:hypothetical protein